MSKAVNAKKPLRRYAVPFDAKFLIFLRWLLPEGAWAKTIWFMVKSAANMTQKQIKAKAAKA